MKRRNRQTWSALDDRPVRPAVRVAATGLAALVLVASPSPLGSRRASAADPVAYTVDLHKTKVGAIDAALAGSSTLVTLRKTAPAGPFALVGRARSDIDKLQTVLGGFGYYDAKVTVTIDGTAVTDPGLSDALAARPQNDPARVVIDVDRGPLFHLRRVTIDGNVSAAARTAFDLHSGDPAVASKVLTAGASLQSALQEEGHAFAVVSEPTATEIPSAHAIDVTYKVAEGPRVDIGPITLDGLRTVHPAFIRRRLLIHQGQLYQPSRIEDARQNLAATGVFTTVQATSAKQVDANGELPITFTFVQAPPRTVSFQAAYSTDLGGSAGVTWTHHNFFGNAEELELAALATGLGGTAQNGLGYDVYAQLRKPDLWARDQVGTVRIEALKQNLFTYDQTAFLAEAGLARKLGRRWNLSGNLLGEQERIIQERVGRDYEIGQVQLSAAYDGTDVSNPLEDPTHGFRASLTADPTVSFGNAHDGLDTATGTQFFTILQGQGATYLDFHRFGLTRPGRSVLAVHAVVASIQGATTFQVPPDQRLYAGGSTTIRGYRYQQVAPLFPDNVPIGGTSLDAIQVEFRQRIVGNIGAAVFGDAGQVAASSAPFRGPLRVGAGVGGRYYTSIGALRLDVAVPLDKIRGDDRFELYIGLGEAF